ncbi:MAG: M56 family metallopeptidase [Pirellulaceae bacterium]
MLLLQRWVADARVRCHMWTVCFLLIIALVAAAWLLPHRRIFRFPDRMERDAVLAVVQWQSVLAMLLLSIWGLGVVVGLCRRCLHFIQLRRFVAGKCARLDSRSLLQRADVSLASVESSGGGVSQLQCYLTAEVIGPFCWQLHRPILVLPEFLMQEDARTLKHILDHEMEHLRTLHPVQHFLQGVCALLFWYHPAVWLAARNADLSREFLCDEVAATTNGRVSEYLSTLIKVAERCQSAASTDVPAGALSFGDRKSGLLKRSERLIQLATTKSVKRSPHWITCVSLMLAVTFVVQQLWLPLNLMASRRSTWSPWPTWTATALHDCFSIHVRDFELFDERSQMHELFLDDKPF